MLLKKFIGKLKRVMLGIYITNFYMINYVVIYSFTMVMTI
jgi:hypothetical protein